MSLWFEIFSALLKFTFLQVSSLIGLIIGAGSCVWLWFHNLHDQIFGVSILLGVASTILMVTSLAMAADLINTSTVSHCSIPSDCERYMNVCFRKAEHSYLES